MKKFSMLLVLLAALGATVLRAQTTTTPVITLASGSYQFPTSTTIIDSTTGRIDLLVLCRIGDLYPEYGLYGCHLFESSHH